MLIEGYNPKGADTCGAQYARTHPEEVPDQFVGGIQMRFGNGVLTTGSVVPVMGRSCRVMAGKDQVAVVLDTRPLSAAAMEAVFPLGRLFRWRGLYWYVKDINGVFVYLKLWGARKEKKGFRLHSRGKVLFATPTHDISHG